MKYRWVTSRDLGNCPIAVDMTTGVLEINKSVWRLYDPFQQKFMIAHEEGHYELDTDSEEEADAYALQKVFLTAPKSLKRSLETLYKVGIIDGDRLDALYIECLKLDAEAGSKTAATELKRMGINYNKFNQQNKMSKKRRVDGGVEPARSHKTNGVVIGDFYLSFTNLLLLSIFLAVVFKRS